MLDKWITCSPSVETPLFRKRFNADSLASASLDISGLGYFSVLINGKAITDDLFTPALSNYSPRDGASFLYPIHDTMSCRVYYMRYDITPFVRAGENTIDVIVGNGWYRQKERLVECKALFGESLIAAFDITLNDAHGNTFVVSSDGSEEGFVYPILRSNLFLGETVDTRLFDKPLEKTPVFVSDFVPQKLVLQTCPSDRVIRTLKPVLVSVRDGNISLYDAGENISGTVKLRVKGAFGDKLTLRFAEEVENGELSYISTGSRHVCASGEKQIQSDTYILNGREQELATLFVFHAFRYFEIEGEAEIISVEVPVIHTDVKLISTFNCDNELINWIYDAYIRSQLGNYHGCIPSDCPHRERLGYTGDGQCCAETAMLTLDTKTLYEKWIDDILDCQGIETGHIQHTAPLMGGGGGPGGWGCAVAIVPWQHYLRFGDEQILTHTFPAMKHWLEYMQNHCENGLMVREEERGWCLGDWASSIKMSLPEPFVNTCYLIKTLQIMSEISEILGEGNKAHYLALAEVHKEAVVQAYYQNDEYCMGIQAADAFAIWAELPHSETAFAKLVERYEKAETLDTGFLGTDILCEVLFKRGRGDLAIRLMALEDENVGFAFMRNNGATTLHEYLYAFPTGSHNHPMFGACVRQLFTGLLGIKQREGSCGYKDIIIEPTLDTMIKKASGSIQLEQGILSVSFDVNEKIVKITLPKNTEAECLMSNERIALHAGENTVHVIQK